MSLCHHYDPPPPNTVLEQSWFWSNHSLTGLLATLHVYCTSFHQVPVFATSNLVPDLEVTRPV